MEKTQVHAVLVAIGAIGCLLLVPLMAHAMKVPKPHPNLDELRERDARNNARPGHGRIDTKRDETHGHHDADGHLHTYNPLMDPPPALSNTELAHVYAKTGSDLQRIRRAFDELVHFNASGRFYWVSDEELANYTNLVTELNAMHVQPPAATDGAPTDLLNQYHNVQVARSTLRELARKVQYDGQYRLNWNQYHGYGKLGRRQRYKPIDMSESSSSSDEESSGNEMDTGQKAEVSRRSPTPYPDEMAVGGEVIERLSQARLNEQQLLPREAFPHRYFVTPRRAGVQSRTAPKPPIE